MYLGTGSDKGNLPFWAPSNKKKIKRVPAPRRYAVLETDALGRRLAVRDPELPDAGADTGDGETAGAPRPYAVVAADRDWRV